MPATSTFRKTKIIATIGPACDDVETLKQMIQGGLNVARLNLSHGTLDEHGARVQRVREAAAAAGSRVAIMIDTRGIEIRTGRLRNNIADLHRGSTFVLRTDCEPGDVGPGTEVTLEFRRVRREGRGGILCYGIKAIPRSRS